MVASGVCRLQSRRSRRQRLHGRDSRRLWRCCMCGMSRWWRRRRRRLCGQRRWQVELGVGHAQCRCQGHQRNSSCRQQRRLLRRQTRRLRQCAHRLSCKPLFGAALSRGMKVEAEADWQSWLTRLRQEGWAALPLKRRRGDRVRGATRRSRTNTSAVRIARPSAPPASYPTIDTPHIDHVASPSTSAHSQPREPPSCHTPGPPAIGPLPRHGRHFPGHPAATLRHRRWC